MTTIAMHVPDGFIGIPMSALLGALALVIVVVAARRARMDLDDRLAPLAGMTAVFIFAAQMINFPVAAGTSGHLLGGALAAVLVGPWVGILVMTVVLVVQALMFADGGITALGINVLNMGVVTVVVGWIVFRALMKVVPPKNVNAAVAAGIAALISVPFSALAFVAEFAVGGTVEVSLGAVIAAMGSVHVLIGIGEGLITGLVILAILQSRPDLVVGLRGTALARDERELVSV